MGPKIIWARIQPYSVVTRAVAMAGPRSPPPLSTSMAFSMLIRPTSVPTMPKAGATELPRSYMPAPASCRAEDCSISFIMISRAWSASLLSTISMMHCLKKGSSCWLPRSSRASRPFLRATWARSTSSSMIARGLLPLVFMRTLKCLGISFRALGGKEATMMKSVQPMVINTLAGSQKLPTCLGVSRPPSPPNIIPISMITTAPATPIIYVMFIFYNHHFTPAGRNCLSRGRI